MSYIFASGAIGAKSTKLFKETEYLTLRKADKGDYFKVLRDLGYGFDHVAYYLDDVINNELIKIKSELLSVVPNPNVIRIWFLKYDLINIKLVLKNHLFLNNASVKYDKAATISINELKEALINHNFSKVSDDNAVLLKQILENINDKMTSQEISFACDKVVYKYMLDEATKLSEQPLITYLKADIDSRNLITMYRAKNINSSPKSLNKALISGGNIETSLFVELYQKLALEQIDILKLHFSSQVVEVLSQLEETKNLSLLEKVTNESDLEKLTNYGYDTFSSGPLVNYLVKKEFEINNVRRLYFDKDIDLDNLIKY